MSRDLDFRLPAFQDALSTLPSPRGDVAADEDYWSAVRSLFRAREEFHNASGLQSFDYLVERMGEILGCLVPRVRIFSQRPLNDRVKTLRINLDAAIPVLRHIARLQQSRSFPPRRRLFSSEHLEQHAFRLLIEVQQADELAKDVVFGRARNVEGNCVFAEELAQFHP